MRNRPVRLLAFLVLGILLTGRPSQSVSASLTEVSLDEIPDQATHWVAIPLLIDNFQVKFDDALAETNIEPQETVTPDVPIEAPLVWNPPGEVEIPILMYHHVADFDPPFRYAVSRQSFEEQMQSLKSWGYTAIPIARLIEAVTVGAFLPERPVVITFDDGYMDVYENAFPIMESFGFQGVAYIIAGQVEIGGFMHADQLKELQSAGWEIGSHTYHHLDLRQSDTNLQIEIIDAKDDLESLIDGPVDTFSFPYGLTTPYATKVVEEAGFTSAVGLGGLSRHVPATQLYLSRIEVQGDFALNTFADLLPWVGPIGSGDPFDGSDQ